MSGLNKKIRGKIAIQLVLNKNNTHKQIAELYGISRQLVTKIAQENKLQRHLQKNMLGSHTYPKRSRANFLEINSKFNELDIMKLVSLVVAQELL